MTITHALIKVPAADHRAVVDFYAQALKPLGSTQLRSSPSGAAGFGSQTPEWWIVVGDVKSTVHVAFGAPGKQALALRSVVFGRASTDGLNRQGRRRRFSRGRHCGRRQGQWRSGSEGTFPSQLLCGIYPGSCRQQHRGCLHGPRRCLMTEPQDMGGGRKGGYV
jgi:hypothetical protein